MTSVAASEPAEEARTTERNPKTTSAGASSVVAKATSEQPERAVKVLSQPPWQAAEQQRGGPGTPERSQEVHRSRLTSRYWRAGRLGSRRSFGVGGAGEEGPGRTEIAGSAVESASRAVSAGGERKPTVVRWRRQSKAGGSSCPEMNAKTTQMLLILRCPKDDTMSLAMVTEPGVLMPVAEEPHGAEVEQEETPRERGAVIISHGR